MMPTPDGSVADIVTLMIVPIGPEVGETVTDVHVGPVKSLDPLRISKSGMLNPAAVAWLLCTTPASPNDEDPN